MKRYLVLILSGAAGYIAYPALAPILLGPEKKSVTEKPSQEEKKPVSPIVEKAPVVAKPKPKPHLKPEVQKAPSFGITAKMQNEARIPDPPVAPDKPETPKVEMLTSADLEKIITQGVESGKYILFRKNNIIEWKLLKQEFQEAEGKYDGEIMLETVNLFGKSKRKARVSIVNKQIRSWHWLEEEDL